MGSGGVATGGAAAAAAANNAAHAVPMAAGASPATSQFGSFRRRTGCSIRTNETALTINVTDNRRPSRRAPPTPVEAAVSHRNSGKCQR